MVRGLTAEGGAQTRLGEICSPGVLSVSADDDAAEAVRIMRENAVRRLPVLDNGQIVGMVSLGDLAIGRDEHSALADISAAPPTA